MDTRRDLQKQYAGGLHEPRNRQERRQVNAAFQKRIKKNKRLRKQKIRKAVMSIAGGVVLGSAIFWALFLSPTPEVASCEPNTYGKFQAWNGQWYTADEYDQMMAEREACLEQERQEASDLTAWIQKMQEEESTPAPLVQSLDYSADDAYLLMKVAMAEAEGEDTVGKALVMLTVLNRTWSDKFPDTIHDVVFQEGAFTSVWNGRYDRVEPNADCEAALQLIEEGFVSMDALYFESSKGDSWHSRNLQKLFKYGNHTFYTEKE